jgi:hypothetical protein
MTLAVHGIRTIMERFSDLSALRMTIAAAIVLLGKSVNGVLQSQ